jgi:hypothetical protein
MAKFKLRDRVRRIGQQETRTVEEIREGSGAEPTYSIQLGLFKSSLPDQCSLKQFACYEESDEPLATDQSIIFDFPPKFAQMNQQLSDLNQPESPGTEHKRHLFQKGPS